MTRFFGYMRLILLLLALLLSSSDLSADSLEKEIALGKKASAELEKMWERTTEPTRTARLDMILSRLTPFTTRPLPFEVRVVRENMINAFSLPGGIVYFTTGMLDFLRTDAEIAAIMAHELVHADRRHAVIQAARSTKISAAALALMIASRGAAAPMILTSMLQVAVTNSYSIELEKEADKEGFKILVSAGFPPAAMVTVLEAMLFDQMKRPNIDLGVFMTHPEVAERIDYILDMAEDMKIPMHRKRALNLLHPALSEEGNFIILKVDSIEVWRYPKGEEGGHALEKAAAAIESSLQMETPPYDIQVIDLEGVRSLRIGPLIAARDPLPEGVPSLEHLRESLIKALLSARSEHHSSSYHR